MAKVERVNLAGFYWHTMYGVSFFSLLPTVSRDLWASYSQCDAREKIQTSYLSKEDLIEETLKVSDDSGLYTPEYDTNVYLPNAGYSYCNVHGYTVTTSLMIWPEDGLLLGCQFEPAIRIKHNTYYCESQAAWIKDTAKLYVPGSIVYFRSYDLGEDPSIRIRYWDGIDLLEYRYGFEEND